MKRLWLAAAIAAALVTVFDRTEAQQVTSIAGEYTLVSWRPYTTRTTFPCSEYFMYDDSTARIRINFLLNGQIQTVSRAKDLFIPQVTDDVTVPRAVISLDGDGQIKEILIRISKRGLEMAPCLR